MPEVKSAAIVAVARCSQCSLVLREIRGGEVVPVGLRCPKCDPPSTEMVSTNLTDEDVAKIELRRRIWRVLTANNPAYKEAP